MCDVCNCIEGGYDVCLSDIGMSQCRSGHTFCDTHMIGDKNENPTMGEMRETLKNSKYYSKYANGSNEDVEDMYNEMIADEGISSLNCPVCQLKSIPDGQMLSYLLYKLSVKREDVIAEIRSAFGTYEKFQNTVLKGSR